MKSIRLLIVEDVEDHALLLVRELEKAGIHPIFERVETLQELEGALEDEVWDAVISDYNLPGFNGVDALRLMQEKGLDLPFLLVSGAIGEEKAAEVMKIGAHDYIRKGNYARLVPTLERELRDARIRHERRQSAEELARHREHLEELVQERTAELVEVNQALQAEIDERKRAEAALQESETRYRTLFESIDEGYCIIEMIFDPGGVPVDYSFLEVNPSFEKQTGLVNVRGRRIRELAPGHEKEWFDIYGRIALSGEAARFQRRAEALRRWYDVYAFRFGPPEDRQVAALFNDITERKQAEDALVRAKEEWERTFNSVPDLIAILDDRQRIVRVNRAMAERLGRPPEECVGLFCSTSGQEIGPQSCPFPKPEEYPGEGEGRYGACFGSEFMITATPLGADGGETGTVYVARDLTERMRAEQEIARLNADLAARVSELEERNQELEAFNRMVSHDLRQPLNTIGLSCQQMEMFCSNDDEICRSSIQMAHKGVLRMNSLIETLLNFSHSTHGDLQRELFNMSEVAESVASEVRLAEPERRVSFRIAAGVTANGDPKFLRAVLENLIGNAWKYTAKREDAVIEFGVTEVEGKEAYFVRDNGKGFDMAYASQLFIPFQRLPDSEEFKGSGIGLATVERIIRRHGGRIWAEGEPGHGAIFYFTLEAGQKDAEAE